MGVQNGIHLRAFPVVEEHSAIVVSASDELSILRDLHPNRITTRHVPPKPLLFVHSDGMVLDIKAHDFVVTALPENIFPVWVEICTCNGLHFRVGDMLHHDWNTIFPEKNLLIVAGGRELPVTVHKSDCVDRTKMLSVGLGDFFSSQVVLGNCFPHVTDQKGILLIIIWVEFPNQRVVLQLKTANNFSSFSIPIVHSIIEPTGQKMKTIIREASIPKLKGMEK